MKATTAKRKYCECARLDMRKLRSDGVAILCGKCGGQVSPPAPTKKA